MPTPVCTLANYRDPQPMDVNIVIDILTIIIVILYVYMLLLFHFIYFIIHVRDIHGGLALHYGKHYFTKNVALPDSKVHGTHMRPT